MNKSRRKRATRIDGQTEEFRAAFVAANALGADRWGTLWLAATEQAVRSMREAGLGDAMETDYRLRTAMARGLYRVLSVAALHPNNLARGKAKIEEGIREAVAQNRAEKATTP